MGKIHKATLGLCIMLFTGCASVPFEDKVQYAYMTCATLDVTTTILALENGAVEANPIVAAIIDTGGYPLLIAVNVGIAYVLWKYRKKKEVRTATILGSVVRCGAGIHNIKFI